MLRRSSLALLPLVAACTGGGETEDGTTLPGDGAAFEGRITAESGTQHTDDPDELDMSAAVEARFTAVAADGTEEELQTVDLDGDLGFRTRVELDADVDFVLIEALDAEGRVVAATVSEQLGRSETTTRHAFLDGETTLEAWVWKERVMMSADARSSDFALVRTLIDARLAGQVYAEYEEDNDIDPYVAALADATLAAQAARQTTFEEAGYGGTSADFYADVATASIALTEDLYADRAPRRGLWEGFYDEVDLQAALAGLDEEDRADAAAASALAFRASIEVADGLTAGFERQADRSAGLWDAWNTQQVLLDISTDDVDVAAEANAFWDDAYHADDTDDLVDAWSDLSTDLVLEVPSNSPVPSITPLLEDVLEGNIDAVLGVTLDTAVDDLLTAFASDQDTVADGRLASDFWADVRTSVAVMVDDDGSYTAADQLVVTEVLLQASAAHQVVY